MRRHGVRPLWVQAVLATVFSGLAASIWIRHGPGFGALESAFCLGGLAGQVGTPMWRKRVRRHPSAVGLVIASMAQALTLPMSHAWSHPHGLLRYSLAAACLLPLIGVAFAGARPLSRLNPWKHRTSDRSLPGATAPGPAGQADHDPGRHARDRAEQALGEARRAIDEGRRTLAEGNPDEAYLTLARDNVEKARRALAEAESLTERPPS